MCSGTGTPLGKIYFFPPSGNMVPYSLNRLLQHLLSTHYSLSCAFVYPTSRNSAINFALTPSFKRTGFDEPFTLHGARLRLFAFQDLFLFGRDLVVLKRTVCVFVSASRCYHMASAVAWLELGPAPGSSSFAFLSSMMCLSPFFLRLRVFLARNFPATQHSCNISRSI